MKTFYRHAADISHELARSSMPEGEFHSAVWQAWCGDSGLTS